MKKQKTLVQHFIYGAKLAWNLPSLPTSVNKFHSYPLIRIFRVIGGISINYLISLPSPPQPHAFVRLPLQCSADPWIFTISFKIPGMLFTLWDNKENIYMAITAATAAAGVFVFMADVSTLDPSQITTSTDIGTILQSLRHATDIEIGSVLDRFLVFWRSAHAEWERYGDLAGHLEREINAYLTHTIPDYVQEILYLTELTNLVHVVYQIIYKMITTI